jgi:hypothetical protein
MKNVRIYCQSKSQAQSGLAQTKLWVIEPELQSARTPEPLMGWMAAGDTLSQLRMEFSSQNDAEEFAKSNGWRYIITKDQKRNIVPRNYGQNHVYDASVEE